MKRWPSDIPAGDCPLASTYFPSSLLTLQTGVLLSCLKSLPVALNTVNNQQSKCSKKCLFLGSWHLEHLLKKTNGHFCLFTHPCIIPFSIFQWNMKGVFFFFFITHLLPYRDSSYWPHLSSSKKKQKVPYKCSKNSMYHYFATFQLFWSLNMLCVRIKPSSKFHWIYPPTSKLWNIIWSWF